MNRTATRPGFESLAGGAIRDVALRAAGEVVSVIRSLPAHAALAVAWDLFHDDDATLSVAGESVFRNTPERLASALAFAAFVGEALELAERLSDTPPWGTIRQALLDVRAAWHEARPEMAEHCEQRRARLREQERTRPPDDDEDTDDAS